MDFANFIGVFLESSLEHNYQRIELINEKTVYYVGIGTSNG